MHVEQLQMETELGQYQNLAGQQLSWQLKESQLGELLRVAEGKWHQMESLSMQ